MKGVFSALALIALASCDAPKGADGYRFEQAEFERTEITVRIVQHDTRAELEHAAAALGVENVSTLAAFGTVHPSRPECTIHVLRIAKHYAPEWLGHELAHCIHGRWHP